MDEQTGSPGATAENNNQRNGDEVRARHLSNALLTNIIRCLPTEPSKCFCFARFVFFFRRNPDVAAGPKGGRGRSQWKTAMHPKPPSLATFVSWMTGGSSSGPSVRTCPSQRSPGCWATSGANCPPRRSRWAKKLKAGLRCELIACQL